MSFKLELRRGKLWWVLYLITTYSVFTLPDSVSSKASDKVEKVAETSKSNKNNKNNSSSKSGGNLKSTGRDSSEEEISREVISPSIKNPELKADFNDFAPPPLPQFRGEEKCNGLDNLVNDLNIVTFIWGVGASAIGFYTDVIPLLNERFFKIPGITHKSSVAEETNILSELQNLNSDFVDKNEVLVITERSDSGKDDGVIDRDALSATAELISAIALLVSLPTLFPGLLKHFVYSFDGWLGHGSMWSKYLHNYRCSYTHEGEGWKKG